MKADDTYRNVVLSETQPSRNAREGGAYIAVIGIDRYRTWNRLYNAVSDARGALKLFAGLGFELVAPPLFDESATGDALRRLVVDDLSGLGEDDSLVLFFAGHGHTMTRAYGGTSVRDGYLIPADGERPGGRTGTWVRLESWLTEIARIPAKHILVILDACHSGLALGPVLQWRSRGMENARREPLEELRARRSRRIITSALDDQLAMDGGPVPGHSLFTGCLIEAMSGGLVASTGHQIVTGSEIGHYVQRRVSEYPGSVQTPDFGALELDDRGELLVHIRREGAEETQTARPSNPLVGAASPASGPPNSSERPSPTRRRALYLWIGGGIVMVVVGGAAALFAMRNTASVEDVKSAFVGLSDVGGVVVTPPDGGRAGAGPDAAQPDAIDAAVESGPRKTDKRNLQQPSRSEDNANPPGSDMPSIDDRGN
jgi:uncharacterized caspase-like protein